MKRHLYSIVSSGIWVYATYRMVGWMLEFGDYVGRVFGPLAGAAVFGATVIIWFAVSVLYYEHLTRERRLW